MQFICVAYTNNTIRNLSPSRILVLNLKLLFGRYSMSVNVIGFVYSGAQALDMSYNLATGKYMVHHQQKFRHYFDFAADQASLYAIMCDFRIKYSINLQIMRNMPNLLCSFLIPHSLLYGNECR